MNLGNLITAARYGAGGPYNYNELSARCGGAPSPGHLSHLVSGEVVAFPHPDTVNALAQGTGYAPQAIINAAARSLGFRMVEPRDLAPGGARHVSKLDKSANSSSLALSTLKTIGVLTGLGLARMVQLRKQATDAFARHGREDRCGCMHVDIPVPGLDVVAMLDELQATRAQVTRIRRLILSIQRDAGQDENTYSELRRSIASRISYALDEKWD